MKQILFFAALFFAINGTAQQTSLYDSVIQRHDKLTKTGLTILSGWSLASIATGLIGQNNTTGEQKYFYKKNILWGGINLGISGLGMLRMAISPAKNYSPAGALKQVEATQRIFLFNTGLDLAYIGLGLYTRERANRFTGDKKDKLLGSGNSLIVQSSFLTLFDGVMYLLHSKNRNRLDVKLENLSLYATPKGLGLSYRF